MTASRLFPHDRLGVPRLVWWLLVAGLAIGIVVSTDRIVRRFVPLASLLKLNLAFPDTAPSRFKSALRRPSARQLERELDSVGTAEFSRSQWLVTLAQRLSAHDPRTRGHSERVRAYSVLIGEQMSLSAADLDRLHWAALLHDIGKLDVPAEILNKPGRPDEDEWAVLQTHPGAAERYLAPLDDWLGEWANAAMEHHCRFDGSGYPSSAAGRDITLAGRIVAAADAFDVMTSTRSYKEALSAEVALKELLRCAGTHFDPLVVRAFLEVGTERLNKVISPVSWLGFLAGLERGGSAGILTEATSTAVVAAQAATATVGLATVVAPVTAEDAADAMAFFDSTDEDEAEVGPTTTEPSKWTTSTVATTTTTIDSPTTTTSPAIVRAPFGGTINDVAAWIEAEHFDEGGAEAAYRDDTVRTGNAPEFRPNETVDISSRPDASGGDSTTAGHVITDTQRREWLEYTVTNLPAGDHVLQLRYAYDGDRPDGALLVIIDGRVVDRVSNIVPTAGADDFAQHSAPISIPGSEGDVRTVRFQIDSDGLELDRFRFVPTEGAAVRRVWLEGSIVGQASSMRTNGCVDLYGERGDPDVFNRTLCEDTERFPDLEPNMNDRITSVAGRCGTVVTLYANTEYQSQPGESGRWTGEQTIDFCDAG